MDIESAQIIQIYRADPVRSLLKHIASPMDDSKLQQSGRVDLLASKIRNLHQLPLISYAHNQKVSKPMPCCATANHVIAPQNKLSSYSRSILSHTSSDSHSANPRIPSNTFDGHGHFLAFQQNANDMELTNNALQVQTTKRPDTTTTSSNSSSENFNYTLNFCKDKTAGRFAPKFGGTALTSLGMSGKLAKSNPLELLRNMQEKRQQQQQQQQSQSQKEQDQEVESQYQQHLEASVSNTNSAVQDDHDYENQLSTQQSQQQQQQQQMHKDHDILADIGSSVLPFNKSMQKQYPLSSSLSSSSSRQPTSTNSNPLQPNVKTNNAVFQQASLDSLIQLKQFPASHSHNHPNNKLSFNRTAGSAFFASNSFHSNSNNGYTTSTTVGSLGNCDAYSNTPPTSYAANGAASKNSQYFKQQPDGVMTTTMMMKNSFPSNTPYQIGNLSQDRTSNNSSNKFRVTRSTFQQVASAGIKVMMNPNELLPQLLPAKTATLQQSQQSYVPPAIPIISSLPAKLTKNSLLSPGFDSGQQQESSIQLSSCSPSSTQFRNSNNNAHFVNHIDSANRTHTNQPTQQQQQSSQYSSFSSRTAASHAEKNSQLREYLNTRKQQQSTAATREVKQESADNTNNDQKDIIAIDNHLDSCYSSDRVSQVMIPRGDISSDGDDDANIGICDANGHEEAIDEAHFRACIVDSTASGDSDPFAANKMASSGWNLDSPSKLTSWVTAPIAFTGQISVSQAKNDRQLDSQNTKGSNNNNNHQKLRQALGRATLETLSNGNTNKEGIEQLELFERQQIEEEQEFDQLCKAFQNM